MAKQVFRGPHAERDAIPVVGTVAIDGRAHGPLPVHQHVERVYPPPRATSVARTIPVVDDRNERLETALRILTKARLVSMQVPNFAIGRWCDAWEAEAERRGLEPSADFLGGRDPLDRRQSRGRGAAAGLILLGRRLTYDAGHNARPGAAR